MQEHFFDKHIILDKSLLERLYKYAEVVDSEYLIYDLETNSATEKLADIYGFGLCWTDQKAFYIPIKNKDGSNVWPSNTEQEIIIWLKNQLITKKVIGHNIIYDLLVTENVFKFSFIENIYSDTILMKHTIDEERPHGLKETAVKYLGDWADLAQDKLKENVLTNGGKWTEDQKDMYLADTEILGEYCCFDVILTLLLFNKFTPLLKEEGLEDLFYKNEVMPLYKEVTINMKRQGFKIDLEHFIKLNKELEIETITLENEIIQELKYLTLDFEQKLLDEKIPVKPTGNFPKIFAELNGIPLPLDKKTNNVTLSKKAIEIQKETSKGINKFELFYNWLLEKNELPETDWIRTNRRATQESIFLGLAINEGKRQVFNLGSGDHLGWLLYEALNITPKEFTESGKPSTKSEIVDELIEQFKTKEPWLPKLSDLRKLKKIKSTYVEGILDRQLDSYIYTSMLQFGTTSGRYASTNPNLQNLYRVKDDESGLSKKVLKYANSIRAGFIAPSGYKIVNADFAQLEVACFAHSSGDLKLINAIKNGEDIYSRVAIDVNNLTQFSAKKNAPNYLKDHKPELRQLWKVPTLGLVYGMEETRLVEAIGCTFEEAKNIKHSYFKTYPNLQKYMNKCNYEVKNKGFIVTDFGRKRHLQEAKNLYNVYGENLIDPKWAKRNHVSQERRKFKTLLNNAKNFPIQGLAAHLVNRAMLAVTRAFKANNIDGNIILSVHDEITCIVKETQAEQAAKLLQDCMENTTKISVPLSAIPIIGNNWAESK